MAAVVLTSLLVTSIHDSVAVSSHPPRVIVQHNVLVPDGKLFTVALGELASGTKVTPAGPLHVPVSPSAGAFADTSKPFSSHTSCPSAVEMVDVVVTSLFVIMTHACVGGQSPREIVQQISLSPGCKPLTVVVGLLESVKVTPAGPLHVPVSPLAGAFPSIVKLFSSQTSCALVIEHPSLPYH